MTLCIRIHPCFDRRMHTILRKLGASAHPRVQHQLLARLRSQADQGGKLKKRRSDLVLNQSISVHLILKATDVALTTHHRQRRKQTVSMAINRQMNQCVKIGRAASSGAVPRWTKMLLLLRPALRLPWPCLPTHPTLPRRMAHAPHLLLCDPLSLNVAAAPVVTESCANSDF